MARHSRSRTSRPKVRYAVIGLGHIAQAAMLPAFGHARRNSVLAALVSGDSKKRDVLGRRYRVKRVCDYDGVDELFASGDVDAVYIALPNDMHREYTVRAAQAGLHVLCEKPMAVTARDCEQMMRATRAAKVKLMIAYRLHFERANLEAARYARSGNLGELRFFSSDFSLQVKEDNIRLKRARGGGPLYDIGIYCINAARYCLGEDPVKVWATATRSSDPRFREVDETVCACFRSPARRAPSRWIRHTNMPRDSRTKSQSADGSGASSSARATSSRPSCSISPTASTTTSSRSLRVRRDLRTCGSSKECSAPSRPGAKFR
jgi:predicted dehydrogenase